MTQPDGVTPSESANYGSLSVWGAKTQGDWEAEIKAPYTHTYTNVLEGLFGGIIHAGSLALSIVSEVVRAILGLDPTTFFVSIDQALASLTHFFSQIINGFVGIFSGAVGVAGKTVTDIFSAIGGFFGAIVSGLTGVSAVNNVAASAWDVHIGADGIRQTVGNLQSEVQAMKFDLLPPGGIKYVDSAATSYPSGWGPNWTPAPGNTGTVYVGTGGFSWAKGGINQARQYRATYNAGKTSTNKQVVGMVLWTLMEKPLSAGLVGGSNWLFARVSDDWQSFIYIRLYYNKVELGCYVDGVQHIWDTVLGNASAGSLWELQAGTEDDDYEILVYQNRQTVCDYTDSAHVSKLGGGYLSGGMGMLSDPRPAGEAAPGAVAQWSLRDLAPPAILGSALRVRNRSSTALTIPGGGIVSSIPNGYFDDVDYCSSDITWNAAITQATISTEASYQVEFSVLFNADESTARTYPALFQNSDIIGGQLLASTPNRSAFGAFTTYCRPGDIISPALAIVTAGNINVVGDSLGQLSWLTITKVG